MEIFMSLLFGLCLVLLNTQGIRTKSIHDTATDIPPVFESQTSQSLTEDESDFFPKDKVELILNGEEADEGQFPSSVAIIDVNRKYHIAI